MVIKFDFRHKKYDGDLLLTIACPIECEFCVYSCTSSKEPWKWMPEKTIRRVAEEYLKNDVGIRISGGEPFYDLEKLRRCIDILLEYYKPMELLIITSGFFAVNRKITEKYIDIIKKKFFDTLVVSVDRFHLKKVPLRNIENIIEVCNRADIEVALRISLDSLSLPLIDKVSNIVTKHKIQIEVHGWGVHGRAEKIDSSPLKNVKTVEGYFFEKIKYFAEKYGTPSDPKYYLTHTAKRSQRKYASEFFPTTFPNGNVYACSVTMKGCYMGNINKASLSDMIFKLRNTLPGLYMLSNSNCRVLKNFLPQKFRWKCEFCRDGFPLDRKKIFEEALGREFIKINASMNLNKLFRRLLKVKKSIPLNHYEREYLLSFRLEEKNLNKDTARKIKNFLNKLKGEKIRFVLSRPLPPCLGEITDDSQLKNCFECRELFTVENGFIRYCEPLKKIKSYSIEHIKNRHQIYEYFKIEREKLKPPKFCSTCLFSLRGQCNGMCFVK
jgi:pyruvate-formate lyase-activating enzyme